MRESARFAGDGLYHILYHGNPDKRRVSIRPRHGSGRVKAELSRTAWKQALRKHGTARAAADYLTDPRND